MNLPLFILTIVVIFSLLREVAGKEIHKNFHEVLLESDGRPQRKFEIRSLECEEKRSRGNFKSFFFDVSLKQLLDFFQKICRRNVADSKAGSPFHDCLKIFTFLCVDEILEKIPNALFGHENREIKKSTCGSIVGDLQFSIDDHLNEYGEDILRKGWAVLAKDRFNAFVKQIELKFPTEKNLLPFEEGRGRRKDHRMLVLIVMGFMVMASVLIPTGFQFLTVLGGKSLLMAKMALILSAISGLKKIATSNVGHGFYHAGGDGYHHDAIHHNFQEKLHQIGSQ